MNPVKLRELITLETEIPVSIEDASLLFNNYAWLARKQMLITRLVDSYNALVNTELTTEQVHVLRGAIMALEAVLSFELTIIQAAQMDAQFGKAVTEQHIQDREAFIEGLSDLLTGD